ncbi:MAG: HAMP domain-containing histidine kinase [Phycisphaerae bacterium]|nr:HAMP domain-containing histidine kinase [Phycisphaerae bacterium]
MKPRHRVTWIVFAVCVLAVLEALGWVTWQAVRAERREREAKAQARLQEAVQLALWRMEFEIAPIMAREAARPYFHYRPFYPAERAYTRMWQEVVPGEVLVPSPLLEAAGPFVRLHFQVERDGHLTSPQAPTGNMRDLAESQYVDGEFIVLASELLDRLTPLAAAAGPQRSRDLDANLRANTSLAEPPQPQSRADSQLEVWADTRASKEYAARQQAAAQTANAPEDLKRARPQRIADREEAAGAPVGVLSSAPAASPPPAAAEPTVPSPSASPLELSKTPDPAAQVLHVAPTKDETAGPRLLQSQGFSAPAPEVRVGPLEPTWVVDPATGTPELLIRREVARGDDRTIQGIWVDWPSLRARLLGLVTDLFPAAELQPLLGEARGPRLAAIPVCFNTGATPVATRIAFGPTQLVLLLTWLAVLGAVIAIAMVLRASMELGDRRGRFVSAVTHELRTPLTTFTLYTDMLASGLVRDPGAQAEYLQTLRLESGRLTRIVENVLAYARLGTPRARAGSPVAAVELVEHLLGPVRRATEAAGMQAVVETAGLEGLEVSADPATVERIVMNLVENSCKYARESSDNRVHVRASRQRQKGQNWLEIRVADYGPGIPVQERSRIFRPFHRSDRDETKEGLGLGLAIAVGLARGLGGEVALVRGTSEGAEFRVTIPAVLQTE